MTYVLLHDPPALICGFCGAVNYHPHDVAELYCAAPACQRSHLPTPHTPADDVVERELHQIFRLRPHLFEYLAALARTGMAFHDLKAVVEIVMQGATRNTTDVLLLIVEWLVVCRDTAPRGGTTNDLDS
jgi:hypothetical protein